MGVELTEERAAEDRVSLKLPAGLESIDRAEEEVVNFVTNREIEIDLFAVRIIVREAMANAVIHGCGKDMSKDIKFEIRIDNGNELVVVVEDPGNGFDWRSVTKYNDILADRGRGLPIMDIYADKVYFSPKGNKVTLIKYFDVSN